MSLTTGRGPLSANPAGRFHPALAAGAVYVEPLLRRVRALIGTRTVIDSERVVLVHRAGQAPSYAFPENDVPRDLTHAPEAAAIGYVRVPWDAASAWFEEDEQVFEHPRNPYHRVDCMRTRRRLRVEVGGVVLVDTTHVLGVYETARAPLLYVQREAVRMDLLVASPTRTYCPYKGEASHFSAAVGGGLAADVAWCYEHPLPESAPLAGLLSFYADRVDLVQDVPAWFAVPNSALDHSHD